MAMIRGLRFTKLKGGPGSGNIGHGGLAGQWGGSDPACGRIAGSLAAGGDPITSGQRKYIKSIIEKPVLTEPYQIQDLNLRHLFSEKKGAGKSAANYKDLDDREFKVAQRIVASRFLSWRGTMDLDTMTKAEASYFLDWATKGTSGTWGAVRGFARFQAIDGMPSYWKGLVAETKHTVQKAGATKGSVIRPILAERYGLDG